MSCFILGTLVVELHLHYSLKVRDAVFYRITLIYIKVSFDVTNNI